jgi:hypothetical protein
MLAGGCSAMSPEDPMNDEQHNQNEPPVTFTYDSGNRLTLIERGGVRTSVVPAPEEELTEEHLRPTVTFVYDPKCRLVEVLRHGDGP